MQNLTLGDKLYVIAICVYISTFCCLCTLNENNYNTRMWANAQRDGCPAEYSWRRLFNAAKFG